MSYTYVSLEMNFLLVSVEVDLRLEHRITHVT